MRRQYDLKRFEARCWERGGETSEGRGKDTSRLRLEPLRGVDTPSSRPVEPEPGKSSFLTEFDLREAFIAGRSQGDRWNFSSLRQRYTLWNSTMWRLCDVHKGPNGAHTKTERESASRASTSLGPSFRRGTEGQPQTQEKLLRRNIHFTRTHFTFAS